MKVQSLSVEGLERTAAPPIGRRDEAIGGTPGALIVLAFVAAFVAILTVYFAISEAPAAIHHDSAEAYAWGREFQLGYPKHPPFWAWICGLWFLVFPRANWAFALLCSLNAGVGLYGAWMLIGNFAGGQKRVAATVLLLLTPFYTFLALKYNANTIFLSVWPWTLHAFMRSLERRRLVDSMLFGLLIGVALMSKYYALVLAAACFFAALQHPSRRRYFTSFSPYLSILVCVAVCAPHVWWLLANGVPSIRYLAKESGRGIGATAAFATTALFGALAQNAVVFVVAAWAAATGPRQWIAACRQQWREADFRILTTLVVAPPLLTIVSGMAIGMKISTNMLVGVFSLAPLLIIGVVGANDIARLRRVALQLVAALAVAGLVLSPAIAFARAWFDLGDAVVQPRRELAEAVTQMWREKMSRPLVYVAGTPQYDTAIVFYSPDRPHLLDGRELSRSPWITPAALAADGLLLACLKIDPGCLAAAAKFATADSIQTEVSLARQAFGRKGPSVDFIITMVAPRG